jgi:MFS family permease
LGITDVRFVNVSTRGLLSAQGRVEGGRSQGLLLVALGGVLENYDFTVFVLFAPVLGKIFFHPGTSKLMSIVQTLGIFAAGNLARPLGGIVMAHYGDLLGRKRTFVFSVLLMAFATLGIASVPTYASIGSIAPILLLLLRIMQGAAVGGELPGAWTFVAEQLAHRTGFGCGLLMSGLSVGNLLAALAGVLVNRLYQPAEIVAFGWRLPFFVGGILALLAVYVRRCLAETSVFRELEMRGELASELPLKVVLRNYRGAVLVSAALTSLIAVTIVVLFVLTPTLLQTFYAFNVNRSFEAVSLATACLGLSCIGCGLLVDRMGATLFLILGAPILAIATYTMFALIPARPELLFPLYSLAGASAGIVAGVPSLLVENFPPAVRFTGLAFSYNVTFAILSGTTPPLIALALQIDPLAAAHAVFFVCMITFVIVGGRMILCKKTGTGVS